LPSLKGVDGQRAEQIERQHGQGIPRPVHLFGWVHTAHAIEQPLERPADGVEHRWLALEDARHVRAERLRQREQDDDVDDQLQVSVGTH
jgi:hypothetical protein